MKKIPLNIKKNKSGQERNQQEGNRTKTNRNYTVNMQKDGKITKKCEIVIILLQ